MELDLIFVEDKIILNTRTAANYSTFAVICVMEKLGLTLKRWVTCELLDAVSDIGFLDALVGIQSKRGKQRRVQSLRE